MGKVCALAAGTVWAAEAEAGRLPGAGIPCVWGGPHFSSPIPVPSPASSPGPGLSLALEAGFCLELLRKVSGSGS